MIGSVIILSIDFEKLRFKLTIAKFKLANSFIKTLSLL